MKKIEPYYSFNEYNGWYTERKDLRFASCSEQPINIKINTKDKGLLFLLGFLFATGKRINIINKDDVFEEVKNYKLDLKTPSKSFFLMAYVWERLGMVNPPITCEFDEIIDNFKRLGIKAINYSSCNEQENKIFLISPVRNATEEQRQEIEKYKNLCEQEKYKIHTQHVDTIQTDILGGYTICHQNANALATSSAVHIYYDQKSSGSMFDLGVVKALYKPLIIINKDKIIFDRNDFGDNTVLDFNLDEFGNYNDQSNISKHRELAKRLKR